ncbi:MAPEG family protein [Alteromonas sp. ASW11-36]|uniref:MAPEG family protein n=1 Tax=Alteromonas arenosi TaxID=3055817 RepID=A0ABT7STF7_9ALTE|nr:MAPEG family protein [Alteromonas sp. ASW11-36]MDM7859483.1 MAPEG family protein [Alteromonas sp. ASW11-36]
MTIMLWCLLAIIVMPILAKAPLAYAMHQINGYDNAHPRDQQAKLTGFGARALAAHKNSFEAIAYFAPAVLAVIAVDAIDSLAQTLALIFVATRSFYVVSYWLNYDKLRSTFWMIGFGCALALIIRLL